MEGVRKQLYIPPDMDRTLKRLAEVEHLSESEVVRKALRSYFQAREISIEGNPLLLTIGMAGQSGPGTGSTHHDDIYDRLR